MYKMTCTGCFSLHDTDMISFKLYTIMPSFLCTSRASDYLHGNGGCTRYISLIPIYILCEAIGE